MARKTKVNGGLLPLPLDPRDVTVGGLFIQPLALPSEFSLHYPFKVKDQGQSDFCAAYSTCEASELQENVELCPEFSFALSKVISGDPEEWGQDLRTMAKAHTKYGALEETLSPLHGPPDLVRKIENWPKLNNLLNLAITHKKETYAFTKGNGDAFTNICSWLYKFKYEKRAVVLGVLWDWPSDQKYIDTFAKGGFGHAVLALGWKGDYLKILNSWGESAGDHGIFWLHRDVVNQNVSAYGALMFIDISPEKAKWYMENGVRYEDTSWWASIRIPFIKALIELYRKLLVKKQEEIGGIPSKWLLPAIIWQESDGYDTAIGDKHLKAKAYGALQIRQPYMTDVYKFKPAQECLNNRALSVDVFNKYMARYATEKQLKRTVTDQDIARIHNGGPSGWKRDTTLSYWRSVEKKMQLLEAGKVEAKLLNRITKLP